MIYRLLPFLFALPLFGTVNEALRWNLMTGYRNDRIHWHLQNTAGGSLTYDELTRDIQLWENGLTLQTIHRDLVFFARGTYGTFGRGNVFQTYAGQPFTTQESNFQLQRDGWTADATGYFGYAVNLTADRTYKVILIPLVGFSAHFERLRAGGVGSPNPLTGPGLNGGSYSMVSTLPSEERQTWYGFFMGGGFLIEPGGRLSFQVGYSYHWLHLSFSTAVQEQVSLYNSQGALTQSQTTYYTLGAERSRNLGHTGWGQIDYAFNPLWRAGIGGQIHYFVSTFFPTDQNQQLPTVTQIPQTFKLRWTSISGWFIVSREF